MLGPAKKRVGKRGAMWSTVVEAPPDPVTGKRRQKRFTAATRRELDAKVAEFIHDVQSGGFTEPHRITVGQFFDRWLESTEGSIRPSTRRRYADLVRLHVKPAVGTTPLTKLSPTDLQRLYSRSRARGLSGTTLANLHYVIHRALRQAVRWNLVARNVCDSVDPPRRLTPEHTVWSPKQVATFLKAAESDPLEALWRLAVLTGMRRGEILGLQWRDVDLERSVLAVRRTCQRGPGGVWEFGEPKTVKGRRSIALPESVVSALRRHRLRQAEHRLLFGPAYDDQDLVFANGLGGPMHPNTLTKRFKRLITTASLPMIRLHDLRHTSATLMLKNGEHPKIVQERLGHADIGMTLNLYSHVTEDMQQDAAARLDALIRDVS